MISLALDAGMRIFARTPEMSTVRYRVVPATIAVGYSPPKMSPINCIIDSADNIVFIHLLSKRLYI